MKVPLSWLREYVDVTLPAKELAHRLTMAGIEVGEVVETGGWSGCFVGQVVSVRPHPQADRLSLCQVTTGPDPSNQMEVVCGAPNVAANQKICFATVGANLLNTHTGKHETLKAAKIRGVESQGMICSELELGLGDDHSGIIVLPEDAPLGTPLDEYLGDTILDLEVTPNRLDCFSILGVAHEVAALTGQNVREPDGSYPEGGAPIADEISITVADPDLCYRYTASLIKGVTIGPSPQWLQDRLTKAGLRPINNVVDVTNFVMLEYNQPLHAFDYDLLKDRTIIVRRAKPGETLVTLDGIERKLSDSVLVIADSNDPIGIGGVIGGTNSEISPSATSVLLESATFDGYNNRETAQDFRLRTEATLRFEKGLRTELAPIALRRATKLIQESAGGSIAAGIIDEFPGQPQETENVSLTADRLKKVLGMEFEPETVDRVLHSLGFVTHREGPDRVVVRVPYWRNDINIEEDLIEEVVRIAGYDSVPVTPLSTPIPPKMPDLVRSLVETVKDELAAIGMQEVINYPLVSWDDLQKVEWQGDSSESLRLSNPMNSSEEWLRPTLRSSILGTLLANQGHGEGPFRLFEVGRVFLPRAGDLPEERQVVSGVLAGLRSAPSWLEPGGSLDFFDAKGVVESLLERVGVSAEFEPADIPFFHPGRCALIKSDKSDKSDKGDKGDKGDGLTLGAVGEVHTLIADKFDLRLRPVVFFELRLDNLLKAIPDAGRHFSQISRFPVATRDLALVLPAHVDAATVEGRISRHRMVVQAELFDIYIGENIPPGTKSLAYHVDFQAPGRTLTTEEVNRSMQGLLRTLEREVQASLRS